MASGAPISAVPVAARTFLVSNVGRGGDTRSFRKRRLSISAEAFSETSDISTAVAALAFPVLAGFTNAGPYNTAVLTIR